MRCLALAVSLSLVPTFAFAQAVTTRIETRPYYGAIVTVEKGVRVWRALPAHDRIIINPDGKARVNINVGETGGSRAAPVILNNSTTVVPAPRRLLRYTE
jgi:hypothetical protein